MKPAIPLDEVARLTALHNYGVLDTPPEEEFEGITKLAGKICEAPISLISFVDQTRQWFKSKVDFPSNETSRDVSFCGYAILSTEILEVADSTKDLRFADNPMVTGEPFIRFYAGAPLLDPEGHALGALCVMDRIPRRLNEIQREALLALSKQVVSQLELRRQKAELAASDERLRLVTDNARVGLVIVNEERRYVYANAAYIEILGIPYQNIVGLDVATVLPNIYEAQIRPRLDLAFSGERVTYELRKEGDSGSHLFHVRYEPTLGPEKTKFVVVVITDITDRFEAELTSRRLAAIVESSDDAIIGKSLESIVTSWNKGAEKLFGYTASEMTGTSIVRLIPDDRLGEEDHILGEIRSGRSVEHFETLRKTKDGRTINVSVTASPIKDPAGVIVGVSKIARDITGRMKAESRFRRLAESNVQGVAFWNAEGLITDANDAFISILGYSRSDLEAGTINRTAMALAEFTELDRQAEKEMSERGFSAPFEKELVRKDGTRTPVLMGIAAFEDNPSEGLTFILDLTERKKIEKQFLRAQRMESIGTLAGGIAHDLNNLLAPITMGVELLRRFDSNPKSQPIIDTIERSASRGVDLVKQVLSFARGVEGSRVAVQLGHIIREIGEITESTFPKNITLQLTASKNLWPVMADPTQINQVVLNLCVNARDAMPNGGRLELSAGNVEIDEQYAVMNQSAVPGNYVIIQVVDTGLGIPKEIVDRIFEPFFTTKEVGKGTGLGLSTVLGIVKSHGGFVNVYSEPGNGTTFKVYLPAETGKSAADAIIHTEENFPRGSGELVMVVDDEASVLDMTKQTLETFGYKVVVAEDGAVAIGLYAVHREKVAVVLTDMMMPVMDGTALISAILRLSPSARIIAASGLAANGNSARASDNRIKHFLAKPYSADTLLKSFRAVLTEKA